MNRIKTMSISVVILTHNEEKNLPSCLRSLGWCNDIVVLDSYSTDETVEIAKAAGIRVFQNRFVDFAAQRNYALRNIPLHNNWVFHLDADEHFTERLVTEMLEAIRNDVYSGFYVASKLMLFGRWLRHAATYPVYQLRLTKIGEVEFTQHGHGQRERAPKRGLGFLCEPYLHFGFSKGFENWFAKHNTYSTQEALTHKNSSAELLPTRTVIGKWITNPIERRRLLKNLTFKLPFRSLWRFVYSYGFRGGFLDGRPGLTYCVLQAIYECMIDFKIEELRFLEKVCVSRFAEDARGAKTETAKNGQRRDQPVNRPASQDHLNVSQQQKMQPECGPQRTPSS